MKTKKMKKMRVIVSDEYGVVDVCYFDHINDAYDFAHSINMEENTVYTNCWARVTFPCEIEVQL